MNTVQVTELLLQSLEQERVGVKIYKTALQCVVHPQLKHDLTRYLAQSEQLLGLLADVCKSFGLGEDAFSVGSRLVRLKGQALVQIMELAREAGDAATAQIVAAECIVAAESKDHLDWLLLGEVLRECSGTQRAALATVCDEVGGSKDEPFYNTQAWARELWLDSLGLDSALPSFDPAPDPELAEHEEFPLDQTYSTRH